MLNEDYRDMLRVLLGNDVRFMVVGAYAMAVHGYPRATGDIDIWVETNIENSRKIYACIKQFGAPLSDISEQTFTEKGIVFQIGTAPRRIDIITRIDGVDFSEAYTAKKVIEVEGLRIPFLSKEDLIKNKLATGREKDRLDAQYLQQRAD